MTMGCSISYQFVVASLPVHNKHHHERQCQEDKVLYPKIPWSALTVFILPARMKKLFGLGKSRKKHKKRLSPSGELAPPDGVFHASSPMYQYARSEFAQTVASGTSNDDGRGVIYKSPSETPSKLFANSEEELRQSSLVANPASSQSFVHNQTSWMSPIPQQQLDNDQQSYVSQFQPVESEVGSTFETQPSGSSIVDGRGGDNTSIQQQSSSQISSTQQRQGGSIIEPSASYQPPEYSIPNSSSPATPNFPDNDHLTRRPQSGQPATISSSSSPMPSISTTTNNNNGNLDQDYLAACSASNLGRQESLFSQTSSSQYYASSKSSQGNAKLSSNRYNQFLDPPPSIAMPDATYEEEYGEAYIGGPIKYIYPSGYQSMRPRSGPWKLSIVIFISFTWLSIFIVGHCSDRVDSDGSQYNQNEIDDDTLVIETRWCGSRLLYMMWVISMLVTGLAAAYCSIIGYIKVRDFAVANSRSQPPGMVGKNDFYAQVDDAKPPPPVQESPSQGSMSSHRNHYHQPIYQSDGNPQFWGGHIYRPTQAAVAITSR